MKAIEERIEEKANERFEKEFKDFIDAVNSSPIGSKLKISVGGDKVMLFINRFGTTGGTFFNGSFDDTTKYGNELTNINEIREELVKKYIQEEADDIMKKIGILTDYINGNI